MVIFSTVEGVELRIVNSGSMPWPTVMIQNNIDHQIHVARMQLVDESAEVICSTKVLVQRVQVGLPIPVVCGTVGVIIEILGDG